MGVNWDKIRNASKGDDDQDWIFSYADMMSLLLGFFIILFSFSSLDTEKFKEFSKQLSDSMTGKKQEQISESKIGFKNEERQLRALQLLVAMLGWNVTPEQAVERIEREYQKREQFEAAAEELKKDESGGIAHLLNPKNEHAKVELVLPDVTLFGSGSATIKATAKARIRQLAETIASHKDVIEIEVEGHTDSLPPADGSFYKDNWGLSAARAGAVAQELIRSGVPPSLVRATGMASLKPLFPEKRPSGAPHFENMRKNRRVHIKIIQRKDVTAH